MIPLLIVVIACPVIIFFGIILTYRMGYHEGRHDEARHQQQMLDEIIAGRVATPESAGPAVHSSQAPKDDR